jgi:serine/threonine-protein kinase
MLVDTLRQHPLLTAEQRADLPQLALGRCGPARAFAKTLIQRGWLTVYQVNQLLAGKGDELVIGPYHVLDQLGQGGLSAVYKARRRDAQNVVAVKMIKAEVFATPEGRQQFLQEVEVMARLDHPNIVQFCDADQWKDTFYFAMEFVEGTDLGKVVRLSGALPVAEACDYIRQAALGLQHAFERNLIHRDIKPVNLFLTHVSSSSGSDLGKSTMLVKPLIKILDWGLASLRNPGPVGEEAVEAARAMVGTADYLAPEQARNANAVDIRGDIYGLGCSFYYLLTGQAPFPDGTLMQKVMAHQTAEPRSIDSFRDDVPPGVVAIVKRMLAKQPEDRFQTPASAALALLPFMRYPDLNASCAPPTLRNIPKPTGRDDTPIPPKLRGKAEGP